MWTWSDSKIRQNYHCAPSPSPYITRCHVIRPYFFDSKKIFVLSSLLGSLSIASNIVWEVIGYLFKKDIQYAFSISFCLTKQFSSISAKKKSLLMWWFVLMENLFFLSISLLYTFLFENWESKVSIVFLIIYMLPFWRKSFKRNTLWQ